MTPRPSSRGGSAAWERRNVPVRFTPSESSLPSYVMAAAGISIFTVEPLSAITPDNPCGVWSMLYSTPLRAVPSLEILTTVRNSCLLGSTNVPCQVPVMS